MISKYSSIKRSISTAPVLNKRQPIHRRPRFVFDYNNSKIEGAIDYNKDIKDVEVENDFTESTDSSFFKAIEKRREMFGDDLKPKDYYTYRSNIKIREQPSYNLEEKDEPHFKVGEKKVYLPEGAITLLPNLPNMSPYFARFKVPKTYNKLDIRDYLFHLYGMKVFDMRVSLSRRKFLPQKNKKNHYLSSQEKVIVVRMEKPFVWPSIIGTEKSDKIYRDLMKNYKLFTEEAMHRSGSDLMKPCPEHIFEGIGGHLEPLPQPFISKNVYKQWNKEIMHNREVNEDKKLSQTLEKALKKLDINKKDGDAIAKDDFKQLE